MSISISKHEDTVAYELLSGYPHSAVNYPKMVQALQDRFGREKLLKQVYVRELLKMVINNAKNGANVVLSKLFDKLESHLRSLELLDITSEQTAEFLYPMVESCLPEDVLIAWQRSTNYGKDGSQEDPPLTEMDYLIQFLRSEVRGEVQRKLARSGFVTDSGNRKEKKLKNESQTRSVPTAFGLFAGETVGCLFCSKRHAPQDCIKAMNMILAERRQKVKEKSHCFSCLKPNHTAKNCKTPVRCVVCGKGHYGLMCNEVISKDAEKETSAESKTDVQQSALTSRLCSSQILLMTCLVQIKGLEGKTRICRVLFDCGSHLTRVRTGVVQALGIELSGEGRLSTAVYGGRINTVNHRLSKLEIESLDGKTKRHIQAYDDKVLCGATLPRVPEGPWLKELKNKGIRLIDFESECDSIDLIIGCQYYHSMLTGCRMKTSYGYVAIETEFGWALSGPRKDADGGVHSIAMLVFSSVLEEADITQLWRLDAIGISNPLDVGSKVERDAKIERNFISTLRRNSEGRYVVRLPWKEGRVLPPDNREVARGRLKNVTSKLERSKQLAVYNSVFREWIHEGIIEAVSSTHEPGVVVHFLPHRPVFRHASETTPVRPVFDASCAMENQSSLNDCLESGLNYMELIPVLLIRFRRGRLGITSDIRKAFQILEVDECDRDALRFLWWESLEHRGRESIFRHRRVVFGVNSSSFILGAVLKYHCESVVEGDKSYAIRLLRSLYVDNCITSVESVEEYLDFKEHTVKILADCKMTLRRWECSYQVDDTDQENDEFNKSARSTVLGLKWNKINDTLSFNKLEIELSKTMTKRIVLATIQRIFDPLGVISPITIVPRMILQQAWSQQISWEQELPSDISTMFESWFRSLSQLPLIEVPRCIGYTLERKQENQLHIFCDASERAYAAAVFLRAQSDEGVIVQLVQARARVAPLKKITIPRLELLACNIAARLAVNTKAALEDEQIACFYWTDSTTALAWIKRSDMWGTFVGNRVKEINSISNREDWRHVPGSLNPADLPSRGATVSLFQEMR